jgi:hypothetical protein
VTATPLVAGAVLLGWLVPACGFAVTSAPVEGLLPPEPGLPGELVTVPDGVGVAVAVGVGVAVAVGVGVAGRVGLADAGGARKVDLTGPGVAQAEGRLNRLPEAPAEGTGPEPPE